MKNTYLIFYNLAQFIGWSVVLFTNRMDYLCWFQTIQLIEVLHCMVGFVKSSAITTLMQITSRIIVLWAALVLFPVTQLGLGFKLIMWAWPLAETTRYIYYAINLMKLNIYLFTWIRYSFFIVLYPTGVSGELLILYQLANLLKQSGFLTLSLPNPLNISVHPDILVYLLMLSYIPLNPYFEIKNLHSPEAIQRYQGKSLGTLEPHVFAIADKAYRDMKAFKQSQSIIINGESGAGKTESQKYVLRYLCLSGSQSGRLEKLILDANPILEAFGNAKTIRNNNSSRFGKYIEIHYTNRFSVSGGLFLHYLLEKSRICTQSQGERNYHIFYQLCACLPANLWSKLHLGAPDKFRYLANGCTQYFCSQVADSKLENERKSQLHKQTGSIQDQLIDDLKCYEQTDSALNNFGVSQEQKEAIYSIVASVLHLGNINFCEDPHDNRGGCMVEPGSQADEALEITCRLMGLEKDLLRQSLTTRVMSTGRGGHKGTIYMVSLSQSQAQAARDALAKAIYSRLFDYIVTRIVNKSIPFSQSEANYYIGVLDVAGFEYFQHNSFEQFLINFCNEKLQQFFNQRILKEEQNIYEKEGLNLEKVEFIDNQDCIQLFESRSTGIFDLLDEESRLPKPSGQHFTQSVHSQNKCHFRLGLPRTSKLRSHREIRDDEGFLIRHFAGAVCYETAGFIEKNNDALHGSLRNLMLEVESDLLRELFSTEQQPTTTPNNIGNHNTSNNKLVQITSTSGNININNNNLNSSNKLNFISVGTTFRSQLNELMGKLRTTGSHFIRCIKPNSEMVAHKFEGGQILSQLHCSGMDSVLKLMQQGYPSRSSFMDINRAYRDLLPAQLARLDPHLFCRALFKALGLSEADFRFGASKVFFRPGKFAEFDEIIRSDSEHVAQLVQRVSRWLVRSRWRKAQYCALSVVKLGRKIVYRREQILKLQRNWRLALIQRETKFRIESIKSARKIERSLDEFEQIGAQELRKLAPDKSRQLGEERDLLRRELTTLIDSLREELLEVGDKRAQNQVKRKSSGEARLECRAQIERLLTKRDLLLRSIKDKLAKQKELALLEERAREERKKREEEELAKRRDEAIKEQHLQLERRRQAEAEKLKLSQHQQLARDDSRSTGGASDTNLLNQQLEEQEQRDYEIAMRLARDSTSDITANVNTNSNNNNIRRLVPLAPSENLANKQLAGNDLQYDLSSWKYCDLRDTINTSCDLELLEACKREFHRRLRVYHAWRASNSRKSTISSASSTTIQGSEFTKYSELHGSDRAPSGVSPSTTNNVQKSTSNDKQSTPKISTNPLNEQRYFRIPFVKSASASSGQRGWWFAHFDGQWIARQLELHPDREPILLIAGQHDIDMCELSLAETRLTSKRGAEILAHEFELEWAKYGGQPADAPHTGIGSRPQRRI